MKRAFIVSLFYILVGISAYANYYYYRGQKMPLVINSDSVIVYRNHSAIANDISEINCTIMPKNAINQVLSRNKIVSSIEHIVGNTITRKMSNCFYVKLYQHADTMVLKQLVEETKTHILGEVPYMENWYKILVANSTINNTLEMSNYFYETGLFADIDPGFVLEFTPNCVSDAAYNIQWALPTINACDAWRETTGDPDVVVAVVDQGIDATHPEFANTSFSEFPYDCYMHQQTNNVHGHHGTRVAGVIAANHNIDSIAGIAPNVSIMPICHPIAKVPNISEDLASGISWAVQHGADVINCSWGDDGGQSLELHSTLLEEALLSALTKGRGNKGCVVVFASGNGAERGLSMDYPGNLTPDILTCGSINSSFQKSIFSAFGDALDIVAPGENLLVADFDNGYCIDHGTSYSAPYLSGIAALILSVNPDLTRAEVTDIIESTAQKVGGYDYAPTEGRPNGKWNDSVGYGLVDAYAAILAAKTKYIQNHTYQSGSVIVENYPEIIAGHAVTDSKPYGNVILEAGSDVTLRAMDKVVLKPGFHAKAGSKLHIQVDQPTTTQSASAPQRRAPRSSSAPAEDRNSTTEDVANNGLETVANKVIVSTSIYTISGQLIQTISDGLYNAADLPNGMYILQHRMSDGCMKSEKIINNK